MQTARKGDWYEISIPAEWTTYTLEILFRDVWKAPKKLTHLFRMEKRVQVNGHVPDWTKRLAQGEKLQLKLFQEEEFGLIPRFQDIHVLYEDDHLIVFNKPAAIDTHPNEQNQTNTLANAAAYYLQAKGEFRHIRHIHRLDRDTTGAILFAKNALAGSIMDKMLEERNIKRTYLALATGVIKQKKGIIDKPIGRDRHHATRRRVSTGGQKAVTHYEVLKSFKKDNLTLIKCTLGTGRTHQIRVHLSTIGHPLAGDLLYGGTAVFKRQALHAAKLEFSHPLTKETIICIAPFLDNPPIFQGIEPDSL